MKYVLIVCYSSDLNEDKLLMFFEMKKKEKKINQFFAQSLLSWTFCSVRVQLVIIIEFILFDKVCQSV